MVGCSLKVCNTCKEPKDRSRFYKHKRFKDGLRSSCKECTLKQNESWRQKNLESRKKSLHGNHIKKFYNMRPEDYESLLESQGNCCAICGKHEEDNISGGVVRKLSVDHCHETDEIRGLLCIKCNTGLGALGDTVESIEKTLAYLKGETH